MNLFNIRLKKLEYFYVVEIYEERTNNVFELYRSINRLMAIAEFNMITKRINPKIFKSVTHFIGTEECIAQYSAIPWVFEFKEE